jgi:hypothetical protein
MTNLERDYVSFEIAKLLKEKGFDVPCNSYYELALTTNEDSVTGFSGPFGWKEGELNLQYGHIINNDKASDLSNEAWFICAAPELYVVQKWLLVTHKLWITITSCSQESWQCHITGVGEPLGKLYFEDFNSPQEALEAAIQHCLNNVI